MGKKQPDFLTKIRFSFDFLTKILDFQANFRFFEFFRNVPGMFRNIPGFIPEYSGLHSGIFRVYFRNVPGLFLGLWEPTKRT